MKYKIKQNLEKLLFTSLSPIDEALSIKQKSQVVPNPITSRKYHRYAVVGLPNLNDLQQVTTPPSIVEDVAEFTEIVNKHFSKYDFEVRWVERQKFTVVLDNRVPESVYQGGMEKINPSLRSYYEGYDYELHVVPESIFLALYSVANSFDQFIQEAHSDILIPSEIFWQNMFKKLSLNPRLLHELPPRKFEELVAELLLRENLDVILTPPSKDGGRDILAYATTSFGHFLYLVECKRYSLQNPVGVQFVRALLGVLENERATAGLLVTSSTFTKGAKEFAALNPYRLSLNDYHDLKKWISFNTKT